MHSNAYISKINCDGVKINSYFKSAYNLAQDRCIFKMFDVLRKVMNFQGVSPPEKRNYYNNLDIKVLDDNKKFWQSIKPLLSNKQKSLQKDITIVDKDNIISKNSKVAEKLNNFFIDAVTNLDIESFAPNVESDSNINYINNILKRYENHPSILKIKVHVKVENKFKFKDSTPNAFETEINRLDTKKAGMENDIPTKVLIDTNDIVSLLLSSIYNNSKNATKYPINLKLAEKLNEKLSPSKPKPNSV